MELVFNGYDNVGNGPLAHGFDALLTLEPWASDSWSGSDGL